MRVSAADTAAVVSTSGTDLSVGTEYTPAITVTSAITSDVKFVGPYTGATTFTVNGAALSFGTLDDTDTADVLTITNSNTTAGSITLSSVANATAGSNAADLLFVAGGANLTLQNGAGTLTLNLNNTGNIDSAGALTLSVPITVLSGKTVTFTGAGSTNLNFAGIGAPTSNLINSTAILSLGGGTLIITGSSGGNNGQSFASTTLIANTSSELTFAQGGATSLSGTLGAITRNAAAILDITLPTAGSVTTTNAGVNGVLTSAAGTAFATVNGGSAFASGGLTIAPVVPVPSGYGTTVNAGVGVGDTPSIGIGANTLTFSGAGDSVAFSGLNTITTGGILVAPTASGSSVISSGTIQAGAGKEIVVINNEPAVSGSLTISSVIADSSSGSSALTLGGTGVTVLSASNTFTGQTNIVRGTLDLANASALQNSVLLQNAGTTLTFDAAAGTAFFLGGLSGSVNLPSTNTGGAALTALTLGNNAGNNPGYSGVISGAGLTLTKIGTNTQSLSGISTYTGATTVAGGILQINGGNIKSSSAVTVNSGAFFAINFGNGGTAESSEISVGISGSGGFIDNQGNPNATVTLDKVNTYSGPTEITNRGVLKVQFATTYDGSGNPTGGSLGINSALIISSGNGTLFLNGINQQVGSLASTAGGAAITLGGGGATGGTLTTGGDNTSTNFTGVISEQAIPGSNTNGGIGALSSTGGAIVKIGTGTQTFSGPNLYEGSTTIAGGVLSVTTLANGGVVHDRRQRQRREHDAHGFQHDRTSYR